MTVRLTRGRLSVAAAYRALRDDRCGGVTVFVGRSRAEGRGAGRIAALDYEADAGLARRLLEALERRATAEFGARRTVVLHRIGRVPVGEPSVIVGAAAPHRDE